MKFMPSFFILLPLCFLLRGQTVYSQTNPATPNIILIIADDIGVNYSSGYDLNTQMPTTPTLDSLRTSGLSFMNAWANPKCTPTRAAIMSGKYGIKTGVVRAPGNLDLNHTSIFNALETQTGNAYADAVIGKWHISSPVDYSHPANHGIDHYEGFFTGEVPSYYNWEKVKNGVVSNETEYVTTHLTDAAINWVQSQNQSWFLWLAHIAPHSPFEVPPSGLYSVGNPTNNVRKYIASIEAMDHEIGRLLDSIPSNVLDNTIIFYIGDNGSPGAVNQTYPTGHVKNSVYQGGVHVPMFVSGAGVSRSNEEDFGLIHVMDIHATILDLVGANLPGGIYNSFSFHHLLSAAGSARPYNYVEIEGGGDTGFAIRNDRYKLIEFADCIQEFYDLYQDTLETNNLINSLSPAQELIRLELEIEADKIRGDWSCQDLIQNGDETFIDDCNMLCVPDNSLGFTNIGCCETPTTSNIYNETVTGDIRYLSSNNYPNHDFCYTNMNHFPAPQYYEFEVDATPTLAPYPTSVTTFCQNPDFYFGIGLNGVLLAPAPATPFIFENPETGEFNWDWVFEPTNNQGAGAGLVGLDCASAHTGPQGYHYHGNMFEYAENILSGISTTNTPPSGPIQIGWAADGFPILYRFAPDGMGGLALLQPSYEVKAGDRPGDGIVAPCGTYNGKYTRDYEYISGLGDLDSCNGIQRTVNLTTSQGMESFDYFYVITDSFPQIPRCHSGVRDSSFNNSNKGTFVPLDLISFELKYLENLATVQVLWTSTNEENVSHFEIERSTDAINFKQIALVPAANNNESLNHYNYADKSLESGVLYYRLKIVDLDGSFSYSLLKAIKIKGISSNQLWVYPNPASEYVNIVSSFPINEYRVELFNRQGERVLVQNESSNSKEGIRTQITLSKFPSGIYFLSLSNGTFRTTKKLIILD